MKAYEAVMAKRSPLNLLGTDFDVEKGQFIGTDDVAPDESRRFVLRYSLGRVANARQYANARLVPAPHGCHHEIQTGAHRRTALVPHGEFRYRGKNIGHHDDRTRRVLRRLAAKGGDRAMGEAFYDSWTALLDKYELIPEVINYADLSIVSPKYWMRPEYVDSSFDLWFLTRDQRYRTTAYRYFQALRNYCRTPNGYTVLTDVRTRPMTQGDYFPAYAFSENFKYLYLMFADSSRFDGSN